MRRGATEIAYDDDAALHAGLESTGDPAVQLHIINDDTQEPAPDAQEEGDDAGEARKGWMYEAQLAARLIREQVGHPIRDKNGEPRPALSGLRDPAALRQRPRAADCQDSGQRGRACLQRRRRAVF